ncbi:MAG: hypothetical protein ACRCU5_11230, partial [Rhizobiaceae bacterium]
MVQYLDGGVAAYQPLADAPLSLSDSSARQSKASIAALVSPFRLKKSEMDMDRREFQTGLVAALALAMSKMPVF